LLDRGHFYTLFLEPEQVSADRRIAACGLAAWHARPKRRCVMGPNVIYLLPCALGVVLNAHACSLEVPGDGLLFNFATCARSVGRLGDEKPVFGWGVGQHRCQCSNKPLPLKLSDFMSMHPCALPCTIRIKQQRQLGDLVWLLGGGCAQHAPWPGGALI